MQGLWDACSESYTGPLDAKYQCTIVLKVVAITRLLDAGGLAFAGEMEASHWRQAVPSAAGACVPVAYLLHRLMNLLGPISQPLRQQPEVLRVPQ